MRTAVVGHHEWVEFARVDHVPTAGEIIHATEWWELPGGGGPGAALQLYNLSRDTTFFTVFGDDDLGHRAFDALTSMGLDVQAIFRNERTRRAVTHIDARGERTIIVIGERLGPRGSDPLDWGRLGEMDAVYFTAGDAASLEYARKAKVLVATTRAQPVLSDAHVQLDAVVGSELDPSERYEPGEIDPPPAVVVSTRSEEGGHFEIAGEGRSHYRATPAPAVIVDRYGAGDAFAAGLTFGLGAGLAPAEAVGIAARCGAAVLGGRGPYETQLHHSDLRL